MQKKGQPKIVNVKFLFFQIVFLIVILLGVCAAKYMKSVTPIEGQVINTDTQTVKEIVHVNTKPEGEMRAVWIPYMSLEMHPGSYDAFKEKFDEIVREAKDMHLNTLIVQVRPYSDALYKSKLYPWSHILTGVQGQDPGYDPLEYMVQKSHDEGLKIHAWVNPLRIQKHNVPEKLCDQSEYFKLSEDKDKVFEVNDEKFYNPAYAENRQKIIDGVKEIVENYSVDGIQFDDYFYPITDQDFDVISFDEYVHKASQSGVALSKQDWRCTNIDTLICGVYSAIKSVSKNVQFGISPQGNVENDLKMGANVKNWGEGFVDYICPQLYVNFQHPSLPFDKMAQQWHDIFAGKKVDLYYGLGMYKAGSDVDGGSWKDQDNILQQEIEYGRKMQTGGFMLYSSEYLHSEQTAREVVNVMKVL